jgi:hypothetical protein
VLNKKKWKRSTAQVVVAMALQNQQVMVKARVQLSAHVLLGGTNADLGQLSQVISYKN